MREWFDRCRFGIVTALILTLVTAYALLDVFVIPHAYESEETKPVSVKRVTTNETAESKPTPSGGATENSGTGENGENSDLTESGNSSTIQEESKEPVITENSYKDENISIVISQYRVNETDVYVADVTVSSPEYLYSALAKETYGRNVKEETSEIAQRAGAILAINGDFYGARSYGYVIRNGVLYRSKSSKNEDLVIYKSGLFGIINEAEVTAEQLLEQGATQVWSFGPALIQDGMISVGKRQEVGQAMASNPRTAIAQVGQNHYLFVVADGRTSASDGLTLYELAQFLQTLGVQTAYNLDGGGSSTMVFMGEVVNKPTTGGSKISERSVSDIVCIGY